MKYFGSPFASNDSRTPTWLKVHTSLPNIKRLSKPQLLKGPHTKPMQKSNLVHQINTLTLADSLQMIKTLTLHTQQPAWHPILDQQP